MSIDHATSLKGLQLYGMATAWGELQAEKPKQVHRPEIWMERLIAAEQTERQLKSLRYQLKAARFPIHRDLLGIDWAETPLSQAAIEQLASAAFMETAHNLILVGGTGTGKSHLATAIGVAAIHQGKRVRFFNAVDLVNQLEREKSQSRAGNLAKQLCLVDAVILDELGYLPFPASGGALLFHLISHWCRIAGGRSLMDDSLETFVPLAFRRKGARRVVTDDRHVHDVTLLEGLARGFYWQQLVDTGAMESGSDIARAEGLHPSVPNELMRLTLLAPDIIELLMTGRQPRRMNLIWFQRNPVPVDWVAQRQIVQRFKEDV